MTTSAEDKSGNPTPDSAPEELFICRRKVGGSDEGTRYFVYEEVGPYDAALQSPAASDDKWEVPEDVKEAFEGLEFQAIRERSQAQWEHKVHVGLMVADYDRVQCLLRFVQPFLYPATPPPATPDDSKGVDVEGYVLVPEDCRAADTDTGAFDGYKGELEHAYHNVQNYITWAKHNQPKKASNHLRTPAEPTITIRELRGLVEGMKRNISPIFKGRPTMDAGHNAALYSLLEAAGKGRV